MTSTPGEQVPNNHTTPSPVPGPSMSAFKYRRDPLNILNNFQYSRLQGDDGHQNVPIFSSY